jgi:hypothetical protein
MRRASFAAFVLPAIVFTILAAVPVSTSAQDMAAAQMGRDQILAYAKVQLAIATARDAVQAELAATKNKTPEGQEALREKLAKQIEEIMHHAGMTDAAYQRATYVVSSDPEKRKMFDDILVELTGQLDPARQIAANAARGGGGGGRGGGGGAPAMAPITVPAGPVGVHVGHIMNGFNDTPNGQGLLPVAMAEARIAAQHAQLALRAPTNLDGLKLHAGHVIHAIDPTVVTMGPGQGYGLKKAAANVVTHIELAAKTPGAAAGVATHSTHVATSGRNVGKRADQILALAKQVQAATTADAAAALMGQISSLAEQLTVGADANGDGRVTWQDGEGGLQHVDEHVRLLVGG